MDLSEASPIAQTKQVNDLARLDNRQTNFTNKFTLPPTANNIRNLEKVSLVGNQSNLPYSKNEADLFDANTGHCLVYKGWANINQVSDKGYEVNIYDGNIDFYRAIENKSLTQIGVSHLNHLKNINNIITSFNDTLPYIYILADYNGKVFTDDNKLNIDYLVPSARASYIWSRIFTHAGFTFSGSFFTTEDFTNLYMTFPKPVPTLVPIVDEITNQTSQLYTEIVIDPIDGGGIFYGSVTTARLIPNQFTHPAASNPNISPIQITQTGAFRLRCEGGFSNNNASSGIITWTVTNASNAVVSTGTVDGAKGESVIINASAGDRLTLTAPLTGRNAQNDFNPLQGSMVTDFSLVLGYDANFEEVLVDFSAKDFVNEIMQRHGLTMFKDKYTNNIEFLTLDEILRSTQILDWSDKFSNKVSEKYTIGSYAQKNYLKYRYNDENQNHNDGYIAVDNVNLKDEQTIINSKIYSPEIRKSNLLGFDAHVYKIWDKELKDDRSIEYKELTGRYYFLRKIDKPLPGLEIKSEVLNTTGSISSAPFESYSDLKFQDIILKYYKPIESILDKSKMLEINFNLTSIDIEKNDFKKLIYVKQLSSYYLLNKIVNFIKGRPTKCEVIEVDYLKELPIPVTPEIILDAIIIENCTITINVTTSLSQPVQIEIIPYTIASGPVGDLYWQPYPMAQPFYGSLINNQVVFISDFLPSNFFGYRFLLKYVDDAYNQITTELSNVLMITEDCYTPPAGTFITITNIVTLSVINNRRSIKIFFDTDVLKPMDIEVGQFVTVPLGSTVVWLGSFSSVTDDFVILEIVHSGIQTPGGPMLPYPYDIILSTGSFPNRLDSNIYPNNS